MKLPCTGFKKKHNRKYIFAQFVEFTAQHTAEAEGTNCSKGLGNSTDDGSKRHN